MTCDHEKSHLFVFFCHLFCAFSLSDYFFSTPILGCRLFSSFRLLFCFTAAVVEDVRFTFFLRLAFNSGQIAVLCTLCSSCLISLLNADSDIVRVGLVSRSVASNACKFFGYSKIEVEFGFVHGISTAVGHILHGKSNIGIFVDR